MVRFSNLNWLILATVIASSLGLALSLHSGSQAQGQEQKVPPAEKKASRVDFYGDPLPQHALARLGSSRLRHTFPRFIGFLPGDKTLASFGWDSTFRVWETATGKELSHSAQFQHPSGVFVLTPDGKMGALRTYEPEKLTLIDMASGKSLRQIHSDTRAHALVFSPDGRSLFTGDNDGTVRLWDVANGNKIGEFPGQGGEARYIALSADGKTLAAAGFQDKAVRIWEVSSGKELYRFEEKDEVTTPAFSPDGKMLAVPTSRGVHLWDLATRKSLRHFDEFDGPVAFSPDGKILAAGPRLCEVSTGKELHVLEGFPGDHLCFSADGKTLAITSPAGMIQLYSVQTGKRLGGANGHEDDVRYVGFSTDGATVTTASNYHDETIRLWAADTGKPLRLIEMKAFDVLWFTKPTVAPHGERFAYMTKDDRIRLVETATGKELGNLAPPKPAADEAGLTSGRAFCAAFSPNGKFLAAYSKGGKMIHCWDLETGKLLGSLQAPSDWATKVLAISSDGRQLAMDNKAKDLQIWDVAKNKLICGLYGHEGGVGQLAFSPDGLLVASRGHDRFKDVGWDSPVRLWDVARGQMRHQFREQGAPDSIYSMAFSPDGKILALGLAEGWISLRDVATQQELRRLHGHQCGVMSVAFSPDQRKLVSGGDLGALVWDISNLPTVDDD